MSPKRKPSDPDDVRVKEREQRSSRPADPVVIDRERGAVTPSIKAQRAPPRHRNSSAGPRGPPFEPDAYSVAEFCERHRISLQLFYKFKDQMPATFRIGARVLISKEAAARWRAEREAASAVV